MADATATDWLIGGGEIGALIRAMDGSATAAGPIEAWPQSLRTAISICLGSRHPIVLWWGPQRAMFYNDAYRPMLGESKHPQFLGQSGQACWAEIWDIIGPMMDHVMATGDATWSEDLMLLMRRSGYLEETYFTFSYSPIRDEHGQPGGIFNACTESTARVLSDRRLRTLRELAVEARIADDAASQCARALARNPLDLPFALIYLQGRDGEQLHLAGQVAIEGASDGAGWPLARVAQLGHPELVACAHIDGLPTAPWDAPAEQALVMPIPRPGSSQAAGVLVLGISPRRAFDDDYRGFFGLVAGHIGTAIANARAYEEERARAEALAELDRAKTEFFSNVSHEFRTPLTLLLGPAEEALADREAPLPARQRERVELIHHNAERLLKLVNTLLDFSRIEAGRARAVFAPTDLARLTTELASVFGSAIERAGLRLDVRCDPLAEPAYVDREMWEKIVLNLISNAFKFTFEGTIAVSLREDDAGYQLRVSDTGIGIAADQLPHLFERFHRVRGARARSHEGTGIGLSLVRELTRLHGGTIDVASTPGVGTTFTVTLPKGQAHLSPDAIGDVGDPVTWRRGVFEQEVRRWNRAPTGDVVTTTEPRPRVLVVDDNADLRSYVAGLLSPHYDVEVAADGELGFARAVDAPPDLVLSDVMMPNLDGFGLVRALRADARTRSIPIILLSARAGEEATVQGLGADADDYLAKPFSASELLARVRTHVTLSRVRRDWGEQLQRASDEALRQKDLAEEASRAKSRFLAAMSHELRTPLNSILGFTDLLAGASEQLTAEQHEQLGYIAGSGQHLLRLINDLLDLSKIEAGRFVLEREPTNLAALADDVRSQLRVLAERAGVRLEVTIDAALPPLDADPTRLRQILFNLISNAIKFTPDGGVVRIAAQQREDALAISVRDTGLGIAQSDLPRLFREFEQLDAGRSAGGTGLGLALTRRLVELHGGTIAVESQVGRGTTFTMTMPFTHDAAPAASSRTAEPAAEPSRGRVLLIEDDPPSRALASAILGDHGYDVLEAGSRAEALQHLEGAPPDVVVSDLEFPGGGGIALLAELRRDPRFASLPVLLLTAHAMNGERERFLAVGFDAYVAKPLRRAELLGAVELLLRRGSR